MSDVPQSLMKHLIFDRGLCQPTAVPLDDKILENDALLASVAGLSNNEALTEIVKVRINAIADEIVRHATPAELLIFRQAMLEVASIIDDANKYAVEYQNRLKEKETPEHESDIPPEEAPSEETAGL